MGDIRNGIKREEDTTTAVKVSAAGALLAAVAKVGSIVITNAQIENNEARKKELSKGFGRFTNSEEISALDQKNSKLRAKLNKGSK